MPTMGQKMRVISLVPSWTETLLATRVNVVGRTRYCVHPEDQVATIPEVGGTKQVDWDAIQRLRPDLLVLDREENPRSFAEESPAPWIATDIQSVQDVAPAMTLLNNTLRNPKMAEMINRWQRIPQPRVAPRAADWSALPGIIEWIRSPGPTTSRFLYVIWKDPWMAVGRPTFIASMFDVLGLGSRMVTGSGKYPQFQPDKLDPADTLLLLASEPFPFSRLRREIEAMPFPSAIVDGESYGWFGIRSLRFLERHLQER